MPSREQKWVVATRPRPVSSAGFKHSITPLPVQVPVLPVTSRSSRAPLRISLRSASSRLCFATSFFRLRSYSANTSSAPTCGRVRKDLFHGRLRMLHAGCNNQPACCATARACSAASGDTHPKHEGVAGDLGGKLDAILLRHVANECRPLFALGTSCHPDLKAVCKLSDEE